MTKITRIEVIDENGRSYVNRGDDNVVSYELQDDGRTLKVFVNKESKMTLKDEGKFYFVHYNHKLYHRMEYTHIPVVWWFENVNTLENPVPLHKKVMDGELIKTLEQLYQEQIVEETTQERGERIHKEVEELLSEDENEWKSVALRFGEQLVSIGPCGYYDFTPDEWLEWALNAYEKLADDWLSLLKKEKIKQEKVEKSVVEKLLPDDYPYKIADEHGELNPYKQYLNSEKKFEPTPQTPEEIEKGLRDAMRQAKKDGVFDEKSPFDIIEEWAEKNKRPSLYDILMEWWINDDWTDQTDESIIDNLVDIIDDQFIPPHHDTNDYKWNQCLKLMREKLR